jgi:hypothetical protein
MQNDINSIRYKRLMRRATFVSICGLVCSLASIVFNQPTFVWSGLAFQVAAVFYGLAANNARRAAIRARKMAVDALKPNGQL